MAKKRARKAPKVKMDAGLPRVVVHHVVKDPQELSEVAEEVPERINWAQSILGIPKVWRETQGQGVKVAVLDTGVDVDHPDLADAIVDTDARRGTPCPEALVHGHGKGGSA